MKKELMNLGVLKFFKCASELQSMCKCPNFNCESLSPAGFMTLCYALC